MKKNRSAHLQKNLLKSYMQMFVLSLLILMLIYGCLIISNQWIHGRLSYQKHKVVDYLNEGSNYQPIIQDGGGVVLLNDQLEVIYREGLDFMEETAWSPSDWARYIQESKQINSPYSYQFAYSEAEEYWLVLAFPASVRMMFSIYYNKDLSSQDQAVVVPVLVLIVFIFVGLLLVVTWLFTKLTAKAYIDPIRELEDKMKAFRDGRYDQRIEVASDNILKELAETYNSMADTIQAQLHRRRRLIQDISHDIKNPLMSSTGYCEYLLTNPDLPVDKQKEFHQIIYKDSMRAVRLADDLLQLAKLEDQEVHLHFQEKDLCEWLREVIAEQIPRLDSQGFNYAFDLPDTPIYCRFDPSYLRRALDNLFSNALKYNPPETTLWISLVQKKPETLALIFEDNGVGIPQNLYDKITQPHIRPDQEGEGLQGSGLGLSIVDKVAKRHGGHFLVDTNRHIGCKFTMELPMSCSVR